MYHREDQPHSSPARNKATDIKCRSEMTRIVQTLLESLHPTPTPLTTTSERRAMPISGTKATHELALSPRAGLVVLTPALVWCPWPLRREARTHISQEAAVPGTRLHAARRLGAPAYRLCDSERWDLSPDLTRDLSRDLPQSAGRWAGPDCYHGHRWEL